MAVSREKKTPQDSAPEPYDKVVERLEKLVLELEGGKLTLEQSIETFAEGVKVARDASPSCRAMVHSYVKSIRIDQFLKYF